MDQLSTTPPPLAVPVRFVPIRSVAEPSFWLDHNARKLNELRLSEEGVSLWGSLTTAPVGGGDAAAVRQHLLPPGVRFDTSSSSSSCGEELGGAAVVVARRNEWVRTSGKIYSLNTVESFKRLDKNQFLDERCLSPLLRCCGVEHPGCGGNGDGDRTEIDDPNLSLVSSSCLTYCDLKASVTLYWFAFPALAPKPGRGVAYASGDEREGSFRQKRLHDAWGAGGCRALADGFRLFRIAEEQRRRRPPLGGELKNDGGRGGEVWCPPFFLIVGAPASPSEPRPGGLRCLPFDLETYRSLTDGQREGVVFGFLDPNVTPPPTEGGEDEEPAPVGWSLRNLVAYLSLKLGLGGTDASFLSYRPRLLRRISPEEICVGTEKAAAKDDSSGGDGQGDGGVGQSLLLRIAVPPASNYEWPSPPAADAPAPRARYRCVGWELNKNNKPGPRSIDLRPLVSPAHLARQANDLNLRLMKWRALPTLDVDMLSRTKVLLLGAGTLGCNVARTLLGWGVRNLTFVDSGRVSYSNPVRQSLFVVDDCKNGGRHKAEAAAESLRAIAGPDVRSESVVLTIPMPGHSFGGDVETARRDVERLRGLVEGHDASFLLTDTRESRWLPTVMALAADKPMINAALGLDSWLVMRHGAPASGGVTTGAEEDGEGGSSSTSTDSRLGCYFCSDIVAPENSTHDRTLDQQCTVTRPGLAPIASSMAAELLVAALHHPLRHRAPAPAPDRTSSAGAFAPVADETCPSYTSLGTLPHQIRGTVATYTMMHNRIPSFRCCTACSPSVVDAYRTNGFEFVKQVCCDADGTYLKGVSGLAEFSAEAAKKAEECLEWEEDEEEEDF